MAMTKKVAIKADLMAQLQSQGKNGKYFTDLVDDYIFMYDLKKKMQKDINQRGLRYGSVSGSGVQTEKPNENVQNILKVNAQMLKILSELGLREPLAVGDDTDGYV